MVFVNWEVKAPRCMECWGGGGEGGWGGDKEEKAMCPRLLSQEGAGPQIGLEVAGKGAQDHTGEPGTTRITQVSD